VRVKWSHPYDNSDSITAYKIEAMKNDGQWVTVCSEQDASIVVTLQCLVPMSLLHFDFSLPFKHITQFRASAYNVNGWGETSQPNTTGA